MADTIRRVDVVTWLQVIPQLIARVDTRKPHTAAILRGLLGRIGRYHPQALVYPLTVASNSSSPERRAAGETLVVELRRHWPRLVLEAETVSRELMRVAILWPEEWRAALEDAAKHNFDENDQQAMINLLIPMHQQMHKGPETIQDAAFLQHFGNDLNDAVKHLSRYQHLRRSADVDKAWELYHNVYNQINKYMAKITQLKLHETSPTLLAAQGLELAVPGTYTAAGAAASWAAEEMARRGLDGEGVGTSRTERMAAFLAESDIDHEDELIPGSILPELAEEAGLGRGSASLRARRGGVRAHEALAAMAPGLSTGGKSSRRGGGGGSDGMGGGSSTTWSGSERMVRIAGFAPHVTVITSK